MRTDIATSKVAEAARFVYLAVQTLNSAMSTAAKLGVSTRLRLEPARMYVAPGVEFEQVHAHCSMELSDPLLTKLAGQG